MKAAMAGKMRWHPTLSPAEIWIGLLCMSKSSVGVCVCVCVFSSPYQPLHGSPTWGSCNSKFDTRNGRIEVDSVSLL